MENYTLVKKCCQQRQILALKMIQFVVSPCVEVTNTLGTVQLHCHDATCKINLSHVYKFVPNYLNF